jgi:beta-ureidopropionase / N-carbamoyl-L-amino-acid hydrolase
MRGVAFPAINLDRLWANVQILSTMTDPAVPWTRRAFTAFQAQSRAWLAEQMEAAGLRQTLDDAGNLVGRREGGGDVRGAIVTGSHCDTVVGGGRFDGIIGVLAGIEVARSLQEQRISMRHPLEVIDFLSEEPSDYGVSCVGSRGMSGVLTPSMLDAINLEGQSLREALDLLGAKPSALDRPLRRKGDIAAFVELHIEQGPVLEKAGLPIGVVTNIVGIRRVLVVVTGQPDHAGTTPMSIRRDALVGASIIIHRTFELAASESGNPHYVVATIGRIAMTPNVPNAVPGRVEMMLEVRSDAAGVIDVFPERMIADVTSALRGLGLSASLQPVSRAGPTGCSPIVMDAVGRAAGFLGYEYMRMPSGAGHDAAYMAALAPMGMIFVPCLNGRSHCPEEWIEPSQLLDGARVLHQTICELDATLKPSTMG